MASPDDSTRDSPEALSPEQYQRLGEVFQRVLEFEPCEPWVP